MANPTTLSNTATQLLPPTITGPIFNKAVEQSAVMSLARRVPLSVNAQTAIPVPMDVPTADWVAEGGVKPAAQVGVGVKLMTGKKVALLVPVSDEVVMSNPGGLYEQLQQDLPTAIARAFDYAAIAGKSIRTGGAGPFADYLALTPNTVALGTTAQGSGGIYADLVTAVGKVVDSNYDMTGWAAERPSQCRRQPVKLAGLAGVLQQRHLWAVLACRGFGADRHRIGFTDRG
jgi:HK97 family phage major capsid protein